MQNLFQYLYSRESQRGEWGAWSLRWALGGILCLGGIFHPDPPVILPAVLLFLYNGILLVFRGGKMPVRLPWVSVAFETFMVTLFLLGISSGAAAVSAAVSPFLWVFLLLVYAASMRLNESLILFSAVLNIAGMNMVFLLRYFSNRTLFEQVVPGAGFIDQLVRTGLLTVFSLILLNRPRIVRRLLKNQQDFFDSIRAKNLQVIDHLDRFAREYALSSREKEVLNVLVRGRTYRMIAEELCISLDTVKSHIKSIYRKLNIRSRNELIQLLRDRALLEGTDNESISSGDTPG